MDTIVLCDMIVFVQDFLFDADLPSTFMMVIVIMIMMVMMVMTVMMIMIMTRMTTVCGFSVNRDLICF